MATQEKSAREYVNEFFDGFYDTAVKAPISFGDFVARISGFRDYQTNRDSVMNLDSSAYQQQAYNEMRILYEAVSHENSRNIIIDELVKDAEARPAYYMGGMGTTTAIGTTFTNAMTKNAYKTIIWNLIDN